MLWKGTDGTLNCGVVLSFSGSATDEWIDGWLVGWLDEWGREDSCSLVAGREGEGSAPDETLLCLLS